MKGFVRVYEFIAALLPEGVTEWEKKNIFFHFLLRKLPKLKREDWAEGLLELVDFDKYRVTKKSEEEIRLKNENAEVEPIPVGQSGGGQPDPNMETLDKIVDDFNTFLGGIEWKDTDTVKQQYTQAASSLQVNDEVRDALLNNDEDTKLQVIHDNMADIVGILTANASELQLRYSTDPNVRQIIDASLLQHLEEQFNPAYNEQKLKEKINEAFADFSKLCGVRYRALTEVIDWYFDVLEATTVSTLDGIKSIRRILNLAYRTIGRDEDMEEWLKLLLSGFEPYMKKIYYLCKGNELSRTDGGFVQFLDAAKAVGVNKLHYDVEDYLNQMKTYYEFVHQQRNDTTHQAPVIEPRDLKPGIHMTVAMYLYATMINITDMEMGGMIDDPANNDTRSQPDSPKQGYEAFDESEQGYSIAAEPGPGGE